MIEGKITFDRAARWMLVVLAFVAAYFVLHYLGAALLPFLVGWLFAYLLYPLVKFYQYRLHVRVRSISIVLAFLTVFLGLTALGWLIIPSMVEQFTRFTTIATRYLHHATRISSFPDTIQWWISQNSADIERFLKSDNFMTALKETMPRLFNVVGETMSIVISIVASFITLLYMFFILLDYEYLAANWVRIFPRKVRPFWQELMGDVESALNNYIRGQGLVALTMGILFCIAFSIMGLPMAIGLGILIGIMDMVPYLHTIAIIPAALLAALEAADKDMNYWFLLAVVVGIFCVVQVIIEAIVTPKVMKHKLGLNPAVLLLSLSVWGTLLGFVGLIIALPATTIIIAYWKRYVTKEDSSSDAPNPPVSEQ